MQYYNEVERKYIFEKDGGRCHFCGRVIDLNSYVQGHQEQGWFIDLPNLSLKVRIAR